MNRAFLGLGCLGLIAACAVACGDDEGSGGAGGAPGTTTATTANGSTTKATVASTATSGSTTNTVGSTSSASTSGSTGTGMMFDCTADPQGDPCFECAKANCCDEAQACAMDPECGACLTCIEMTGDIAGCAGSGDCNLQDPRTQTAGMCIQGMCSADCGLGG